jgi:hypothetical protein
MLHPTEVVGIALIRNFFLSKRWLILTAFLTSQQQEVLVNTG